MSDAEVLKASRDFVCVRLLTYESKEEGDFLMSLFKGREGTLENTVFTFLASDGKTTLSNPLRTPKMAYGGAGKEQFATMVEAMKKIVAGYKPKKDPRGLPRVVDLRRALDTAACDNLPLAVFIGDDDAAEKKLAELIWSDEFVGRFTVVKVKKDEKLDAIKGAESKPGLLLVAPGRFGLDGTTLGQVKDASEFKTALAAALKKFKPEAKDPKRHIDDGHRAGIAWKTEIPDTDPGPANKPKRP